MSVKNLRCGFVGFWMGVVTLIFLGQACAVVDLPVFYRAPFFQGEQEHKVADWSTQVMARYGQGNTWDSYDNQSKKQTLLSGVGPMDIARLGLGTPISQATQPRTHAYWGVGNQTPSTFSGNALPTGNNGKIDITGKFETHDLGIELTQFIKYGFFGQVYVPFREVKIDHLGYKNKGDAQVNGVAVAQFFQSTQNFDAVLKEHGMKPFATPFKKSGVSDVSVTLGWQGYGKIGSEWIMNLGGRLQAGVVLPVAGELDKTYVAAVPLGYNGDIGFTAHGSGEINIFDWISVGAYAGGIIFLEERKTVNMRTHEDQSGWLRLGKGFAKVEQGTLWDAGGYVRLSALIPGLSIFCGYSFTRQEATTVRVQDPNFKVMLTRLNTNVAPVVVQLMESTEQGDKDAIVNADPRLQAWETHVVHVGVTFDLGWKNLRPRLQVEYSHPFDGQLTFKTPVFGGTIGLQFGLGF